MATYIIFGVLITLGFVNAVINYRKVERRLYVLKEFYKRYSEWIQSVQNTYIYEFSSGDLNLRTRVAELIPEVTEAVEDRKLGVFTVYSPARVGIPYMKYSLRDCFNLSQMSIAGITY